MTALLKGRFSVMSFSELRTVIVCLRDPANGAAILTEAARTAESHGARLLLFSVQPTKRRDEETSRIAEEIYRLSRRFNAEMHVVFGDEPVLSAAALIRRSSPCVVFTGMPSDAPNGFIVLLHRLLPDVMLSMVSEEGVTYRLYPHAVPALR